MRTNVGRSFDLRIPSIRRIVAISVAAGAAVTVLSGWPSIDILDGALILEGARAGFATFLIWAITREIDPDHEVAALVAAALTGVWVGLGNDVHLLALTGLIMVARLPAGTTGERPLRTDLLVIALLAAAISFTPVGFVTGFAIAVAVYADNRLAETPTSEPMIIALATAGAAAGVASLTAAFPAELPAIRPLLVIGASALALMTILREPPEPTTESDSGQKTFLRTDRVHLARSLVALVVAVGTLVSGSGALGLVPVGIAVAVSLASSEIERLTRRRTIGLG